MESNSFYEINKRISNQDNLNNPTIETKYFLDSENYTDAIIKIDDQNEVIYVLLFFKNNDPNIINSTLYILFPNNEIKIANIIDKNQSIKFSNLYVLNKFVIATAPGIIGITFNQGLGWTIIYQQINIIKAIIHPTEAYAAVVDSDMKVYEFVPHKSNFKDLEEKTFDVKWKENDDNFFHLKDMGNNKKDLVHVMIYGAYIHTHFSSVEKFGIINTIIWVLLNENNKKFLKFEIEHEKYETIFPFYVKIEDIVVINITEHDILVAVKNQSGGAFLYFAWIKEFKFSRITSDLSYQKIGESKYCFQLEIFKPFPGLILANFIVSKSSGKIFTAISFNSGIKWIHIRLNSYNKLIDCIWPICYINLTLKCLSNDEPSAIKYDLLNPALMVAHGAIINGNNEVYNGLMISVNAGYSWKTIPKSIFQLEILNGGSVLVGIPRTYESIIYSFNMGIDWKSLKLFQKDQYKKSIFNFASKNDMIIKIIALNQNDNKWALITVNFSNTIQNKCEMTSFESFTPGTLNHSKCFQGKIGIVLRKIPQEFCYIKKNSAIFLSPIICPCTEDDFGCSFGYFSNNKKCLVDPDMKLDQIDKKCTFGHFVSQPLMKRKIPDNLCKPTDEWKDVEYVICGVTENDQIIIVFIGSVFKVLSLSGENKEKLTTIPININNHGVINHFEFDFLIKCLYILNKTGIYQIFYHDHLKLSTNEASILTRDVGILGFSIDNHQQNIFYFNSSMIFVINSYTRQKKILCNFNQPIKYMNIVPELGILTVAVFDILSSDFKIHFMNMICEKTKETLRISDNVIFITFDHAKHEHAIFTNTTVIKLGINSKNKYNDKNIFQHDLINSYFSSQGIFHITKTGISLNDKFFYINHVKVGRFYLTKPTDKHPCQLAECHGMCIPLTSFRYSCICTDNFIYNETSHKCECDPSKSSCSVCQMNEFECDNGKCIDKRARCDGVDHCSDKLDEKDCKIICSFDEILCDNQTLCVPNENICDKINHCKDKSDELHCHEFSKCKQNEYTCLDKSCIPTTKFCDNVEDCPDISDEINCPENECRYFESRCDNGDCILNHQICDGHFDCSDLSDERACHQEVSSSLNKTCSLICENLCIPGTRVCDHYTDCRNLKDESNCNHEIGCHEPYSHVCATQPVCYLDSQRCDGFTDCLDKSDEIDCEDKNICDSIFNMKCQGSDKCIDINKYCDGIINCDDKSDEPSDCKNTKNINTINFHNHNNGSITLYWTLIGFSFKKPIYNVTVRSDEKTNSYNVETNFIQLHKLKICQRYSIMVNIKGSKYGRYMNFTYINSFIHQPKNLNYNLNYNTLVWTHDSPPCMPQIFYIQCYSDKLLVYRNFVNGKSAKIPFNYYYSCRVISCPKMVFNISCSEYSSIIKFKYF